ncbi:ABC transporter substrate-binding protein [Anaerococcus prevotii]|uniref:ABC transporter, substrate-binding protein, family 5 n=1 Tax=Anaerococcus prevotii ACS-065-V-Col13 TaxID=879305 RepID=F0GW22_9FIRM|nr:ABC transporter substrate-binding protein [Anaerococcus prevotii]EGC81986.1 ABC transporter, substrate-binding protein, family 5 [Anaerococcus prevotii ACS-065-V-Col13]
MKMKRVFSSLMALGLASTLVACGGGENKDDKTDNKDADTKTEDKTEGEAAEGTEGEDQSAEDFESQTSDDTLVVGLGELNGDFLGGWTNNAGDVKVRRYMGIEGNNGYKTVVQDEGGEWVNNKAVLAEDPKSEDNEDGSKTVTFKLKDGLKWSDGEPVTADDYLFASLLHTHPEYSKLTGSTNIGHDSAKGYEAYKKGDSDVFEGLEKVDDLTFKVTIDASFLPYYEEAALLAQDPLPMHALSENLAVSKEGDKLVAKDGYTPTEEDKKAYVEGLDKQIEKQKADFEENYPAPEADASEEDKAEYEEAKKENDAAIADLEARKEGDVDPTQQLIDEAMLKEVNEYRVNPSVVAGPYKFDSYSNNMVKLSLNENYAGNFKGEKATIPNVILQVVNQKIAVDLLENGDIDIWEEESDGGAIDRIREAADKGTIGGFNTYERNGYGNLTFLTDRGTTKYKEVRQAIAHLMDRNSFVQSYAGGYGVVTNGMYGTSQWMYKERGADLEGKLVNYQMNLEQANELLDKTPFKFESDGTTPWDKAKADEMFSSNPDGFDYYRYDENGKKLVVNQYGSDESPITTLISNQVPNNAKQVGMEYNVTAGSFSTLINYYTFPEEDPEYTAFNMGTGFGTPFDPWYQYHSEGSDNKTRTNDPKADEITEKLRRTAPDKKEEYLDTWEEFEIWYNDYLPEIPLYANQYHTGYTKRVKGFDINTPVWPSEYQINAITLEK